MADALLCIKLEIGQSRPDVVTDAVDVGGAVSGERSFCSQLLVNEAHHSDDGAPLVGERLFKGATLYKSEQLLDATL